MCNLQNITVREKSNVSGVTTVHDSALKLDGGTPIIENTPL